VSGTTRFLGRARGDCSAATFTFTAPLKRHVKPNGRCESADSHGLEIEVYARGCTKATRVVGRVERQARLPCAAACRAGGRSCTPLLGGRLSGLASVGCPRGRIELVVSKGCGGGGGGRRPAVAWGRSAAGFSLDVRAINTSCERRRTPWSALVQPIALREPLVHRRGLALRPPARHPGDEPLPARPRRAWTSGSGDHLRRPDD
jgi:hypothetical protein